MVKVGINGFGRIGRLSMRAAWEMPELEIVHVNEIKGGASTAAYMLQVKPSGLVTCRKQLTERCLQFDSVHGRWNHECVAAADGNSFDVDGKKVQTCYDLGFS
jgi:glyceraldehyde 3-phosphate dehydrogenase